MRPPPPVPEPAEASPARWGVRHAIGSLAGFGLLSFGVLYLLTALGADPIAASLIGTMAGWVSLAGWPVVVSRRLGNGVRADLALTFRPVDLGIGLLAAFGVVCAAVIFVLVYLQVTGELPTSAVGDIAERSTAAWQIVALVVLALGAPFVEELHFRGMWWSALRRRGLGDWPVLLITSALFALVHLEPGRFPILLAAGLAAGFVRMITGRLGPAIVTHFLINGLASLSLLALLAGRQ